MFIQHESSSSTAQHCIQYHNFEVSHFLLTLEFKHFFLQNNIKHTFSDHYCPTPKWQDERAVHIFQNFLKNILKEPSNLQTKLWRFLLQHRIIPFSELEGTLNFYNHIIKYQALIFSTSPFYSGVELYLLPSLKKMPSFIKCIIKYRLITLKPNLKENVMRKESLKLNKIF